MIPVDTDNGNQIDCCHILLTCTCTSFMFRVDSCQLDVRLICRDCGTKIISIEKKQRLLDIESSETKNYLNW